jgi:hypothetical protein
MKSAVPPAMRKESLRFIASVSDRREAEVRGVLRQPGADRRQLGFSASR